MPGNPADLCLAEAYTASADGLSHDFLLRDGPIFHNGEKGNCSPHPGEDVRGPPG